MNNLTKIIGIVSLLTLPFAAHAQSLLDRTDAKRLQALIRANLCDKTCRMGDLRAERYIDERLDMLNGYKFYLIKSRGPVCDSRGCPESFMAINTRSALNLAEGYRLNPKHVRLPATVAVFADKKKTQTALCQAPGRQLNTALLKQTFAGKILHGTTAKGANWSEELRANGRTLFVNAAGKETRGEYIITRNSLCFKYRKGEDYRCKAVYECNSSEGEFVLANQANKLTSVITRVSAGGAAPQPANPIEPLVPEASGSDLSAALADCRAIRSDLRRLKCYDALATPAQKSRFDRRDRARLTELMNFRNLSGVTLTQTTVHQCTLTIKVDAPEVRLSFANEAVIDLSKLDLGKSQSFVRGQDALFSFVAQGRHAWPLKTIDKSRNSERNSRNAEALLAVAADPKDLPEVEKLVRTLAEQCQR